MGSSGGPGDGESESGQWRGLRSLALARLPGRRCEGGGGYGTVREQGKGKKANGGEGRGRWLKQSGQGPRRGKGQKKETA